jgi:hypothetical protein
MSGRYVVPIAVEVLAPSKSAVDDERMADSLMGLWAADSAVVVVGVASHGPVERGEGDVWDDVKEAIG